MPNVIHGDPSDFIIHASTIYMCNVDMLIIKVQSISRDSKLSFDSLKYQTNGELQ